MLSIRNAGIALAILFLELPTVGLCASKFAMNFVGERIAAGDARSIGLGGEFQMIPDSLAVLQRNPASLASIIRVTAALAQQVTLNRGKSSAYTEKDLSVKTPALVVGVPVGGGIVFGIGYRGRYDPDGTMEKEFESPDIPTYKQVFKKSGGLYSVPLTIALRPHRTLSLGFHYSLERGSLEQRWETHFKEQGFAPGAGVQRLEVSGSGYGAGVILFPRGPLIVGASYESAIEYDADVEERYTVSALDANYSKRLTIPAQLAAALTWVITPSWLVAGSAVWRDFNDFDGSVFADVSKEREVRYALGVEYARGRQLPLRASVAYEVLPYAYPETAKIERVSAALGTGLIFVGGKGKIDFALQVGKTGSIDENLMEDRFVRFYLSLSGSEEWKRHGVGE